MDTSIFGQASPLLGAGQSPASQTLDALRPVAELSAGACLQGKYTVLGVLGHGGFAVVYDAEHIGLGRRVAVKVLHVGDATPLALIERFRREARISALVSHPNVLEVYDTGQLIDGSPFLVMERVNGENLSALIRRGPLSIAATVEIGRQLLLGLSAIADAGIVHRDVKPDNIMLHDAGDGAPIVKLVDFGISKHVSIEPHARLTCHGALVGTPQYMAPEQIRGEEVDAQSDLYAAGAVLYEALAGQPPHQSDNFSELVVAVLNNDIRPLTELRPNCPPELARIIFTALARSRAHRYGSPRHLLEALEEFACVFDLPRGPDAFRASDQEFCVTHPARSSNPGQRKLGWREAKLPLQIACVAMFVFVPRLLPASSSAAVEPGPSRAQGVPVELATAGVGAIDPLGGQLVTTAPLAPSAEPIQERTTELTTVAKTAELARSAPREGASLSSKKRRALPSPTVAQTEHGSSEKLVPTSIEPPLSAAERANWEQTMQSALSALVRGRLVVARDTYAQAVKLAPREAAGYRGLGLVSARLGDNHGARVALRHYLALAPTADDASTISTRLTELPN